MSSVLDRRHGKRGFTLLEVLIVGVIVAVVGVMTLSAVTKLHRAARGASCAANLGLIVHALNLYTIDNTGYYP